MNATHNQAECPKCNGKGFIGRYSHVASGTCFRCAGSGKVSAARVAQDRYKEIDAMHCATLAEAQAFRTAEFVRRFPELAAALAANPDAAYRVANGMGKIRTVCAELAAK